AFRRLLCPRRGPIFQELRRREGLGIVYESEIALARRRFCAVWKQLDVGGAPICSRRVSVTRPKSAPRGFVNKKSSCRTAVTRAVLPPRRLRNLARPIFAFIRQQPVDLARGD